LLDYKHMTPEELDNLYKILNDYLDTDCLEQTKQLEKIEYLVKDLIIKIERIG